MHNKTFEGNVYASFFWNKYGLIALNFPSYETLSTTCSPPKGIDTLINDQRDIVRNPGNLLTNYQRENADATKQTLSKAKVFWSKSSACALCLWLTYTLSLNPYLTGISVLFLPTNAPLFLILSLSCFSCHRTRSLFYPIGFRRGSGNLFPTDFAAYPALTRRPGSSLPGSRNATAP
jgi:hypothetical protein